MFFFSPFPIPAFLIILSFTDTDDPSSVLCLYKTENECVMKFTYSEHASGQSILTALQEPGQYVAPPYMKHITVITCILSHCCHDSEQELGRQKIVNAPV